MTGWRDTPWTRAALTPDEEAGLKARAAALGALVAITAGHPGGPWTIHASSRSVHAARYGAVGPLAVAIHAVLDEFRDSQTATREDVARYTPEELVQIAIQSGIEVERA